MRRSNSLRITSSSRVMISIYSLPSLSATGPRLVESSTTRRRPSLCGLMRRISLELSPCSKALTFVRSSRDSQELFRELRKKQSSLMMNTSDTSPHAPLTSELASALQFTSAFPSSETNRTSSRLSLTSTTSRSEVPTVSTPRLLTTCMTSPI